MQKESQQSAPARLAVLGFAGSCYLLGLAGAAVMAGFVLRLGLEWLPLPETPAGAAAWAIDLGWLFVFALQHSGMARRGFKVWWTRWVPDFLERSVYAGLSGLVLLAMCLTWQPLGGEPLWRLPLAFVGVGLLGGVGMALINLRFDHLGLFGVRQYLQRGRAGGDRLLVFGPYRLVRHPLMGCLIVFLWGQPVMGPTLAVFSGGLTLYILGALVLEERDLVRRFGRAYLEYRRRVPALLPWQPPAPASSAEEVTW
jgi:protein-S-isoprenylcysteine O-methyltransferase Ste14